MIDLTQQMQSEIEEVVRKQLADAEIDAVRISMEVDYDGEDIMRILVVHGNKSGLDTQKTKGLVRHIRSLLEKHEDGFFPLLTYRTRSDQKHLKSATA
jgi:hypothetical protein